MSNVERTKEPKVHYPWNLNYVYCNMRIGPRTQVSSERRRVTCKNCKRDLRGSKL